jgi:CHAT domain-containing protein/tetratricopeptide (TPR) repeat protein
MRFAPLWLVLFTAVVLGIAGPGEAARPSLGVGLPADSLPPQVRTMRTHFADGRAEPLRTAAWALHDSLVATGDTLSLLHVYALEGIGEARWIEEFGRDTTLQDHLHRVLERKRSLLGDVHPEVARALVRLAQFHSLGRERYAAADSFLERAERTLARYYGPDDLRVAGILKARADTHHQAGDYVGAESMARRALARMERDQPMDSSLVAGASMSLSMILGRLGQGEECLAPAKRSYDILVALHGDADHPRLANAHLHLGQAYGAVGSWPKAMAHQERALAIREEQLGPDHLVTRNQRSNLGISHFIIGDDVQARKLLVRSLEGATDEELQHSVFSATHAWLGILELSQGRLVEAQAALERSLAMRARLGPSHPDVATVLEPLAITLGRRGKVDSALVVLEEARAIQRNRTADGRSTFLSTTFLVKANLLASMGRMREAAESLHEALAELPDSTDLRDGGVWAIRLALAKVDAGSGERQRAVDLALDLEGALRDRLREGIGELPERQALRLAAVNEGGLELALSSLRGTSDLTGSTLRRCYDEVIRSRALVLDVLAEERGRNFRRATAPDGEAWSRWDGARRRWRAFRADPPSDLAAEQRDRLAIRLREEMEAAEVSWRRDAARERVETAPVRDPGLRDVARALSAESALLSFVRVLNPDPLLSHDLRRERSRTAHYLAFVLKAGEEVPTKIALGSAASLDSLIGEWHQRSRNRASGSDDLPAHEAGLRLRRALWDPVASALEGTRRVYLVPDGDISRVNFAALPVGEGRYLIDQPPLIELVAAERDLVPVDVEPVGPPGAILAVGGVNYDSVLPSGFGTGAAGAIGGATSNHPATYRSTVSECRAFSRRQFDALPASALELSELRSRADAGLTVHPLSGAHASEVQVKRQAPGSRALHLATHGFVLDADCPGGMDAAASRNTSLMPGQDALLVDNPLTRCGLALAGANRRVEAGPDEEDGLLTGDEIAALDLSGVEFVVLSACNTGVGDVLAGEGVLGLQRAFKMAGAGPVVMSLWPVEDQVARQWMRGFYQARLTPGVSTAEATTRASKAMLTERRRLGLSTRPSTWAPFVSVGVDR